MANQPLNSSVDWRYFEDLAKSNPLLNSIVLDRILCYLPMADIFSLKVAAKCLHEGIDTFLNQRVVRQAVLTRRSKLENIFLGHPAKKMVDEIQIINCSVELFDAVQLKLGYHLRSLNLKECKLRVNELFPCITRMENLTNLCVIDCHMYGSFATGLHSGPRMRSISFIRNKMNLRVLSMEQLVGYFPKVDDVQLVGVPTLRAKRGKLIWNIQTLGLKHLHFKHQWEWTNVSLPCIKTFYMEDYIEKIDHVKSRLVKFLSSIARSVTSVKILSADHVQKMRYNCGNLEDVRLPKLEFFSSNCFYLNNDQYKHGLQPDFYVENRLIEAQSGLRHIFTRHGVLLQIGPYSDIESPSDTSSDSEASN